MEYVKGETLDSYLDRHGPLELNACFALFHQALDGIQHAHEAGVVHRDIKSSNLMLDPTGQLKWIDFGIALVQGRERMTREGGLMGTPEYMSPEQVHGEAGTIRSDVYSLGIVLYRMLTGGLPFSGQGEYDIMRAHVETEPPSARERGAAIGPTMESVLLRALLKDPEERFAEIRADMESAMMVRDSHELMRALEVQSILDCADMAAHASLYRTESRWGLHHYRVDYPERDNEMEGLILELA